MPQNYLNHVRYYAPHHFILYPVLGVLAGLSFYFSWYYTADTLLWIFLGLLFVIVALMSTLVRNHYALNNQNRIVRLEMRFRYFVLTGKRLEPVENKLGLKCIYALRYASDEELPALVERAANDNLNPDEIKRAIKNWLPDEMRA